MTETIDLRFSVGNTAGTVAATMTTPRDAQWLFVMAHGAGAGMRHNFLETVNNTLCDLNIATFRYQFPYMERGSRRPDPPAILHQTVRRAIETAREHAPSLSMIAGGKSMGGRMTSQAIALSPIEGVRGLAFLGFPLHPPKKPSAQRGEHLRKVAIPMIFIQGTRDALAAMDLITLTAKALEPQSHLHVIDGADHSFHVLKRSGRTEHEVHQEIGRAISEWIRETF